MPAIRFAGFDGEWEEKYIEILVSEKKRYIDLQDDEIYQLVTVKRRNAGVFPRTRLLGKNILVKTYFIVKEGDYLISKRQVVHGANGIVPENLDGAVVSNEYLVIVSNENMTTQFWTILSKRPDMWKKFFISSYGVDIEKLVFDVEDWKKRKAIVPSLIEQKQLTSYFQQLDTLIAQHQQKHDKLQNIKKALLEKCFPKQGEHTPELRFKGFSGAWEEKALGDVCEPLKGKLLSWSSIKDNGKHECILYGHLYTEYGMVIDKINYFTDVDSKAIPRSVFGDILIPGSDTTPTGIARASSIQKSGVLLGGDINILRPHSDYTGSYLSYNINKNRQKLIKLIKGTSVKHLVNTDLVNIELSVTKDKKEQTKIGKLFQQLDTLINQQQTQLGKLKNIKQACLEKMFV